MAEGIRFECQPGCTACCRQQGFVYLSEEDLVRVAGFLGMPVADFEQKYVFRTRHKLRLRTPRHATCHFLREDGCSIHPAKPTQCRAFPFWPELVASRREWNRAAHYCPGIGKGPLIQIQTAREQAQEMQRAYPGMYKKSLIPS